MNINKRSARLIVLLLYISLTSKTKAITVAIKEFAPDKIILLGPGNSLGAPTAQILIKENWLEMDSKESFQAIQDEKNYIISMSRRDQRLQVCKQ